MDATKKNTQEFIAIFFSAIQHYIFVCVSVSVRYAMPRETLPK